tara:strand:- start:942 stop:1955 length:1014 start_codon:yes stop_codon:yes gene_type:complete
MSNIVKRQILEPTNLKEAKEFADTLSKSGLVPKEFQAKPANILVAVQWGYEIGLAPMQALQNIAVINGRPSLWGDSLLALVKSHPAFAGSREWMEGDIAFCEIKRTLANGKEETTLAQFSKEDAQRANLLNKQGPWKQYPKRMMQLRARGFAIRDAFPDAVKGMITAEEAMDYPEPKDITPQDGVEQAPSLSNVQTAEQLTNALQQASEGDREAHADAVIDNMADHAEPGEDETETPEFPDEIPLKVPGLDGERVEWFKTQNEWVEKYADLQLAMYQSTHPDLPPDVKRTKMKDLKDLNQDVLESLDDQAVAQELEDKRLRWNKSLSIMARENQNGE